MKIYLVFKGEYSDRRCVGVFSGKALAEGFVTKANDGDIEEFEVDKLPHKGGLIAFSCSRVCFKDRNNDRVEFIDEDVVETHIQELPLDYVMDKGATGYFVGEVMARDEKHAIKIFNEQIMMYKANKHLLP